MLGFGSPLSCRANNYEGGMTELINSLGVSGTNTFTATGNISASQNLGALTGNSLTINGNLHTIDGAVSGTPTYSGITVASGKFLNINNYGSYSGGTVNSAIENFTSASPNGAFLNNSGTFVSSSNVYSSNSIITSLAAVSDGAYGSAVYNSGVFTSSGDVYKGNYTSATSGTSRAFGYGGAIYNNSGTANISNATFDGNYVKSTSVGATNGTDNSWAFGGAVYNLSTMNFTGSNKFTNNYAQAYTSASGSYIAAEGGAIYNNGTMTISGDNNTFSGNYVLGGANYGGAIFNNGIFAMSGANNVFSGNYSGQGGAIYNSGLATATILGASFTDNGFITINSTPYLTPSGGAIMNCGNLTLDTVNFKNNVGTGGAVENYAGNLYLKHSTFTENGITSGGSLKNTVGGAIYNVSGANIFDIGSTYISNQASNNGGAIVNQGMLSISDGAGFTNNKASSGGAIYNSGTGNISSSTFGGNSSAFANIAYNGGAIYNTGTLTSTDNDYKYNAANGSSSSSTENAYGGAVYNSGKFYSTGDSFEGNSASATSGTAAANAYGGAIYNLGIANIYSGTFLNNYTTTSAPGVLTPTSSSFAWGGAIENAAGALLNIYNSDFKYNYNVAAWTSASTWSFSEGGAIQNYGVVNIYNGTFENNGIRESDNTTLTQYGSAIYSYQGALNVYGGSYIGNASKVYAGAIHARTGSTSIFDATFTSNSSKDAGALYNEGFSNGVLNVYKSDFQNNVATNSGGAIYTMAGTTNIYGGTFKGNNATSGGAVYNNGASTIIGSKFQSNVASSGGAIYNNAGSMTISGGTFSGNNITSSNTYTGGGAIYNSGTTNIYKSTFENNTASDSATFGGGGAIYSAGPINIYNSTFTNNGLNSEGNVLTTLGGAINLVLASTDKIYGSTFTGNKVTILGGAINVASSALDINNSIFSNNSVISGFGGGGAIGRTGTATLNINDSIFSNNSSVFVGGAFANLGGGGCVNISNSIFNNNDSVSNGGAIYNTNYLNLIADGGITSFTGNKQGAVGSKVSNAIYASGILNLNSGNGGYILFNDKLDGVSGNNNIYINRTGDGTVATGYLASTAPKTGNVIFNEQISNAAVYLNGGMMTLGSYKNDKLTTSAGTASSTNYFNNSSLTLNAGTLNTANGNIDSNTLNSLTSTASANLLFDANLSTGTNDHFTVAGATSGTLTLGAVNITNDNISSASGNINLISSGSYSGFSTTDLHAYTNHYLYDIGATTNTGILGYTRTGDGTSYNGLGNAVQDTSTYRSFSATGYVMGIPSNLGAMGGTNSALTLFGNGNSIDGNSKSGITIASGQTLNVFNFGSLNESNNIVNSIKNFVGSGLGFVYDSGTLNISNSIFYNNQSINSSGVIFVDSLAFATINDSIFSNNQAVSYGGAIFNGGTTYIENTKFIDNKTTTLSGGSIYNNTGQMSLSGSTFSGNIAYLNGGAITNASPIIIQNSSFTGNSATTGLGGAIYNVGGVIKLIADNGNTTFTGNTDSTGNNDLYINAGTVYMNAGNSTDSTNGIITFNDKIASSSTANTININKSSVTSTLVSSTIFAPTNGTVNFYDSITADSSLGNQLTMNIYDGTTNFGKSSISNIDIDNVALNVNGGSQNFTNTTFKGGSRLTLANTLTPTADSTNFTGATFTGSGTYSGSGGALSLSSGTLNITNSNFKNYIVNNKGGAIYNLTSSSSSSSSYSDIKISNSIFGSSLATGNSSYKSVSADSTSASGVAGAIYSAASAYSSGNAYSNLEISNNSSFTGNNATAIATGAGTSPYAQTGAGALYLISVSQVTGSANNTATISDATFTGNYSKAQSTNSWSQAVGGAISNYAQNSASGSSNSTVNLSSINSFNGNYAESSNSLWSTAQGGAIYNGAQNLSASTNMAVTNASLSSSAGTSFQNNYVDAESSNSTTAQGGAIWNQSNNATAGTTNATVNMSGDNFTGNYAKAITTGASSANAQGGAIWTQAYNTSTGLTTATVNISGTSKFSSNYSEASSGGSIAYAYGGAIYNSISGTSTSTVNISDSIFENNYVKATALGTVSGTNDAIAYGGALYNASSSIINILGNTQFNNNYAKALSSTTGTNITAVGGAIMNYGTLNISGNNNSFSDNYVLGGNNFGGAIYNAGTITVSGSNNTFSGNYAGQGGALYNNSGTVTISNASFLNNGIATINSSNYNTAYGGAIINKSTMILNGCNFEDNYASVQAGAIGNFGGTLTITDSTFTGNSSGYGGGGAICNNATLKIFASEGGSTSFSGNHTSGGFGNDIYLNSGSVYLNAASGGIITFDDGLKGNVNTTPVYINSLTGSNTWTGGTIDFYCPISTATLNIYNGITNFGNSSLTNTDLDNVLLNVTGGSQNFTNTTFKNGSRLVLNNATTPTTDSTNFTGATFSGTTTVFAGGALNITSGTANLNSSNFSGYTQTSNGSAIYNNGGILNMTNGSIKNNSSIANAGAIFNNSGSVSTLSDVNISSNSAASNGGALFNNTSATMNIIGGTLSSNNIVSGNGGAIFNETGSTLNISGGTTFIGNTTHIGGGAIFNVGTATITDAAFTGNTATTGNGGAINQNAGILKIFASDNGTTSFSGNTANGLANDLYINSGSIYLNAGLGGNITFNDGITSSALANLISVNSTAGSSTLTSGNVNFYCPLSTLTLNIYGGTTNFGKSSIANVNIDDVLLNVTGGSQYFTNTTFKNGSRLTISNTTTPTIDSTNITGATFIGSGTNTGFGEAIYLGSGTLNIDLSNFSEYKTSGIGGAILSLGSLNITGSEFDNNYAGQGGAIYNTGNSVSISGSAFKYNGKLDNGDGTYTNKTSDGGAIINLGTINLNHDNFIANAATYSGGAIENFGSGVVNVSNSSFVSNTAASLGGAIYNRKTTGEPPTLTVTGCTFGGANSSDANSSFDGGAIYNEGTASITNSSFTNNKATSGNGGAIYNTGTLNITANNGSTSFTTNSASGVGGAIYNQGTTTILAQNNGSVSFTGNTDSSGSNAIYLAKINSTTGSTLNLNAVDGGSITFSDKITSDSFLNVININKADTITTSFTDYGTIYFYNTVSGATINLYAGTLAINDHSTISNDVFNSLGGTIAISGTTTINNGTFSGGTSQANSGISNFGTLTLNSDSFTGYSSTGNGGVISNSGNLIINSSTFGGSSAGQNIAARGGAIYNIGNAFLTDTSFTYNKATDLGGAIYNTGALKIIANSADVSFANNFATNGGSDLYLAGGSVYLNASSGHSITFADSISSSSNTNSINVNATNVLLSDNSTYAPTGGTVNFNGAVSNANLNIYSGTTNLTSSFTKILSTVYGGALNITSNNSSFTSVKNSNLVLGSGGAIYNQAGILNISSNNSSSTTISNNSVTTGNGGAIANLGSASVSSNNSSVTTISNNAVTTGNGGAIYNEGSLDIIADNSAVTSINSNAVTTGSGGAIYNKGTLNLSATNNGMVNITGNTVTTGLGGAIYNSGTTQISSDNASVNFTNNKASNVANDIYLATYNSTTGSTLNLNAGNGGSINFAGGIDSSSKLNTVNVNSGSLLTNGTVNFNGGVSNLTMNIDNGTTNFGSGNYINNSTINVLGGTQNFDSTVFQNGSRLVVNNSSSTDSTNIKNAAFAGTSFTGSGGAINVNAGKLNILNTSFSGYTASSDGGAIYNSGETTITNSSFTNNTATSGNGGAIYNSGTLNVSADGKNVVFSGNKASGTLNAIYLASGAKLNLNASSTSSILFNDKITSDSSGTTVNINKSGILEADGTTIAPTTGTVILKNTISASDVNLYGGTLALSSENLMNGATLNINGDSSINLINSSIGTSSLNSFNIAANKTLNLGIDVDLASQTSDKITALTTSAGTNSHISISQINVLKDANGSSASVSVVDPNLANYVSPGVSTVMGPIFKYNVNYDSTGGVLGFSSVNSGNYQDYNPSILSKTVSSLTGTYLNQVNVYNEALGRAELFMSLPHMDRVLMRDQNKYASADDNMVFSPLFTPSEQGGLWVKQYTTFENIPLNNGPNVSNVSYGALIGADTAMKHMKHGYDGYLTAYVGYNGSHQNYDNVGIYQNGGSLGLTGTLYKGNFFTALTANIGATNGNSTTSFGVDNFTTLLAGLALKSGYNFELMSGKIIIQPSCSVSYTYANTYDYKTASGMNISSNPLNAIQISPGVKIISNMNNGWQPYLAANMVWNIMDAQRFYANDVPLPLMSIAPYLEYGLGIQRRWGDRLTGFAQAMARGGGRNGIALQFGFRCAIGK